MDAAPGDTEQEHEADAFAAEFLTPADQIRDQLPRRFDINALGSSATNGASRSSRWCTAPAKPAPSPTPSSAVLTNASTTSTEVGILGSDPVTQYPGETPAQLAKAFELAENHAPSP
ncbi:hypothetical protein ACLMAL_35395 [Nocardia sp. CWNU-33]|uniref:ImmA/IrrE family metallo-endopeptidase n=1 Tax=Nocardia sp. CWNU-33 TaxID=3392117 RepID=UPI00398E9100